MGAFAQVYVESKNVDERRRKALARMEIEGIYESEEHPEWLLIQVSLDDDLHELGRRISDVVGATAIAVGGHSVAYGVSLSVHRSGKTVRELSASDDGWEVSGTPQSWEAALFEHDPPEADDEAALEAFESKTLRNGVMYPLGTIHRVLDAVGLPSSSSFVSKGPTNVDRRQSMLYWLIGGIVVLALEGVFLPRDSGSSTAILAVTLVVWIAGLKRLQARAHGASITG
ncbi:MAG: hypothetical protein AAF938_03525 [Myxococcota bacterium]